MGVSGGGGSYAEAEVTLTAVETLGNGGTKMAAARLDSSRLLVVESRRAVGYDHRMEKEGALVYVVHFNVENGQVGNQPMNLEHDCTTLVGGAKG